MSCAPWLSRGSRGGRDATAAGQGTGLPHAAPAEDNAADAWDAEAQTRQRYQLLQSLPSSAAAAAGGQQEGGRAPYRQQRRAPRKFFFTRGVEEGESTAAVNGEYGFERASDSRACDGKHAGDASSACRLSASTLGPLLPASFSDEAQEHAAARNASSNKSRSSGNSECSATQSRRSNRIAADAGSGSTQGGPTTRRAAAGGEKQSDNTTALGGSSAAAIFPLSSNAPARAPARATRNSAATATAQAAAPATAGDEEAATRGTAAGDEAAGRKSRTRLRAVEQLDSNMRHPQSDSLPREASRKFPGERRECKMGAENVSPSRRTSVSRSSAARGRLGSPPCEASDATSEEAATRGAAEAWPAKAAAGAAAGKTYGGVGEATGGRAKAAGGGAESESHEEGRESRFPSVGASRYSRHSLLSGRRRTGRLTQRWSSAFLRSRRSALPEDSMPVVLPMSQNDWVVVDRLSRKINSSNFATVLKAYLIIKTRLAAQRANKEYTQSQTKGRPAAALRLLLNRQNNRVALRMRAAEAGGGGAGGGSPPAAAEAAATAAAASTVEAAAAIRGDDSRSSRSDSQSERGSRNDGNTNGVVGTTRGSRDADEGSRQKERQQELAAAVRVAASAGGGSVIGCGVLGETRDVSVSSISLAAEASSAAGTSGVPRRQNQNRLLGLKGVGEVGRMQAHQSLLEQRLAFLGLRSVCIKGDGNCLFRSCSYNLYGSEEYHRYVRLHATQHMRSAAHQKDYSIFFECASQFDTYLKNMQRLGTWGDELCVRAIADSFECTIHIITSTDSNWYLRYDPQTARPTSQDEEKKEEDAVRAGQYAAIALLQPVKAVRHIFLTYISPIHYNAFTIAEEEDRPGSQSE